MRKQGRHLKILRLIARLLLGGALIYAGIGHLTFSRAEFQAQVPSNNTKTEDKNFVIKNLNIPLIVIQAEAEAKDLNFYKKLKIDSMNFQNVEIQKILIIIKMCWQ